MLKGLWFLMQFGWKSDKKYIIYHVIKQFVDALLPLLAITMPKFILDELIGLQRTEHLALYIGLLIVGHFTLSSLSHYLTMHAFTLRVKVAFDFSQFMNEKLILCDYPNLESPSFLDMKEKAQKFLYGDWHGFAYVLDSAMAIIGQFFTFVGIVGIIATLDLWLVFLFILLVILSTLVEAWAKKNDMRLSLQLAQWERQGHVFGSLFDDYAHGKEIRLGGIGPWILAKLKAINEKGLSFYRKRNGLYILSGLWGFLMMLLQQGFSYAYLVFRVLQKNITIGDFTMYVGAVSVFAQSMKTVMSSFVDVKAYGIYYDAMEAYLNIPAKMRENKNLPLPTQPVTIEFRHVCFRYPGQTVDVLKDINITLKAGEKLSIVGENGAGKTTFIKLLTRLYDPTQGEILCNDIPIQDIAYDAYMSLFSVVFQDFKLFSFSLKENIAFEKAQHTPDHEIETLLTNVGFDDKLAQLPKGIHTSIHKTFDETGFEPSGGEGQKISLARALFKNARVVILDEPTAALDPKAEYQMLQNFHELVQGNTAVFISHRLSSARICDHIAVFAYGQIVEYGSHDTLLAQNGTYAQLFHMQAQSYVDAV